MNEIQREFLMLIEINDKGYVNAKDACKSLKIEPERKNPDGGYYVALMKNLDWIVGDPDHPLTYCVDVHNNKNDIANEDKFYITQKGREHLERYRSEHKKEVAEERSYKVGQASLIVAIIAVIVAVYFGFK